MKSCRHKRHDEILWPRGKFSLAVRSQVTRKAHFWQQVPGFQWTIAQQVPHGAESAGKSGLGVCRPCRLGDQDDGNLAEKLSRANRTVMPINGAGGTGFGGGVWRRTAPGWEPL